MFLETMPVHAVNGGAYVSASWLRTTKDGRIIGLTRVLKAVCLGPAFALGPPETGDVSAFFTQEIVNYGAKLFIMIFDE